MFFEEIKNIRGTDKDFQNFGLLVGTVFLVLSGVMFWFDKSASPYLATLGLILALLGFTCKKILGLPYKLWMGIAMVLGWVMTRLILTVLFYLLLTPISILSKLIGKQFLDLDIEKSRKSYWNVREVKDFQKIDYEQQF